MKTIGVISDTHCQLPEAALAVLRGEYRPEQVLLHEVIDAPEGTGVLDPAPCDMIAHAGDVGYASDPCPWILDDLEAIAPLVVVTGNCDWPEAYRFHGQSLPQYETFSAEGVRFAMLHRPKELHDAVYGGGMLNPAYIMPEPRVLIHGHTHVLRVTVSPAGTVTICPGSPTQPRGGNPATVAVVKLEEPGRVLTVDIVAI